ncbi:hypothetical protein vseg_013412 [Gypsophila vaccaria]
MSICLSTAFPQDCLSTCATKSVNQAPAPFFSFSPRTSLSPVNNYSLCARHYFPIPICGVRKGVRHFQQCAATARNCDAEEEPDSDSESETQRKGQPKKRKGPQSEVKNLSENQSVTKPRKPRRGRRSEAVAVEDFVRDTLEKTFASIREENPDYFARKAEFIKKVRDEAVSEAHAENDDSDDDDDDDDDDENEKMVVDADDPNWPADADVGWGLSASDYFEKNAITNVVGDDGVVIDWEGEMENSWLREINCLEWETFAYHPSPLIVLVFERYNRAAENWKLLKELEKAFQVYWSAKDRLPPRAVKLDINIEKDLAYALRVKQCPQILFLRGQSVLYRETEHRTADELVQMIAHFYYKAKKPSWMDDVARVP